MREPRPKWTPSVVDPRAQVARFHGAALRVQREGPSRVLWSVLCPDDVHIRSETSGPWCLPRAMRAAEEAAGAWS